jgi:hypothetical protein
LLVLCKEEFKVFLPTLNQLGKLSTHLLISVDEQGTLEGRKEILLMKEHARFPPKGGSCEKQRIWRE